MEAFMPTLTAPGERDPSQSEIDASQSEMMDG
jgi:hypothetical protein